MPNDPNATEKPMMRLVSSTSDVVTPEAVPGADISVAVELMYDLERFARHAGRADVAREIELACQRIKFILGVDQR